MSKCCGLLAGKSILVVENEWLIANDLYRALTCEGAHVLDPVGSVGQALALINECRVDAAVLDVHLGNRSDIYPVAELLRARIVPFMFATGYDAFGVRRDFADVPHLTKPYAPSDIGRILAEVSLAAGQRMPNPVHLGISERLSP